MDYSSKSVAGSVHDRWLEGQAAADFLRGIGGLKHGSERGEFRSCSWPHRSGFSSACRTDDWQAVVTA